MKKNFFSKAVALAAIMLAGLSLNSCDEKDNAIIDGKVWVKPEVTLTDGGAIVTASSPDDISRMIGRVRQEMAAAAQNGKTFTLDIDAPVLNATSSDNTISIPTINGGDVVVNFKSAISTEVPLVLETKGVADDAVSTTSTNKVAINIPSTSDADLKINMPFTTVTLDAASGSMTIDELVAKTALNTLNIGKGVTVNWLKMTGGRALVEEGGKVLGYLRDGSEADPTDYDARIYKEGVQPLEQNYTGLGWRYDVYYIKDGNEETYYAQNLKIVKGEKAKYAYIYAANGLGDNYANIVIADGAGAAFAYWNQPDEEGVGQQPKINIKGEGNKTAKIYSSNPNKYDDGEGNFIYSSNIDIRFVKEMSNVTVDGTTHPEYAENVGGEWEYSEVELISCDITVPELSTDCNFKAAGNIGGYTKNRIQSKVTNCTLVCKEREDYSRSIYSLNVNNSNLTAERVSDISAESENTTFKSNYVAFTNDYVSGNTATLKSCKFETSGKNPYSSILLPYQTDKRSSFNFIFDNCQLAKDFRLTTSFSSGKPAVDKDGKLYTKRYSWYELNEAGDDLPKDKNGNFIWNWQTSFNESDIPEANKNNGIYTHGGTWGVLIGYEVEENSNGFPADDQPFKDFKCYITFDGTTLGGAAITDKTEIIRDGSGSIATKKDKDGNITTKTYFVIGGKNYEAIYNANTTKWLFVDAE